MKLPAHILYFSTGDCLHNRNIAIRATRTWHWLHIFACAKIMGTDPFCFTGIEARYTQSATQSCSSNLSAPPLPFKVQCKHSFRAWSFGYFLLELWKNLICVNVWFIPFFGRVKGLLDSLYRLSLHYNCSLRPDKDFLFHLS